MLTAAQVLAENNFGDTRTGGLAGPMGLFLITVLAIATVLLIRNMNARLRRLPERFPHQRDDEPSAAEPGDPEASAEAPAAEESGGSAPNAPQQDRNSQSAP
ncbi:MULTISPECIES: hypothetical protein [unclassified Plantactinospora]|uniref:hypothetical protein n=1 Tax=unclassified Plantactinospora TaxID=2631981 RepID=UPI000D153997|nr:MULTISPECIES: hypothetical protein [unclassified Plantactinospora]AVT31427.1 hypothetical protein C6361_20275 [Plantactinospora sp. BC1]AVT38905.1 hypothetical protein C6W10_23485 [Plantactinospora sp. BB1]